MPGGDDWVLMAEIIAAHGIRGAVKIRYHGDDAKLLAKKLRWKIGSTLLDTAKPPQLRHLERDFWLVHFAHITDRNQAETLRHQPIFLHRDDLPALSEDEIYHHDLIGMRVYENTQHRGIISDIVNFGAGDLLVITHHGHEIMLPLHGNFVTAIDPSDKRVEVSVDADWWNTQAKKKSSS